MEIFSNDEKQIKELKAENEKLTERLIKLDHSYKNQIYELQELLQEIKEIAGRIAKSTIDRHPYGGDEETWEAKRAKQILQKISECEGE